MLLKSSALFGAIVLVKQECLAFQSVSVQPASVLLSSTKVFETKAADVEVLDEPKVDVDVASEPKTEIEVPEAKPINVKVLGETKADLEVLAMELNPVLGFYDPLDLANSEFWSESNEASIGFLRHAEIKHGRVAMAAFVGYIIQSNYVFSWPQSLSGAMAPDLTLSPEQQWDAIDINAKWQILLVLGFLEIWDEMGGYGDTASPHYMRGRQPGKYPSFQEFREGVHWVPDLYDPLGVNGKMSDEKKKTRLLAEINNGRLAMLGIFGFLVADKIPGALPSLAGIARPYDGEPMNPFQVEWGSPFVMTYANSDSVAAAADAVAAAADTAAVVQ